MAARILNNINSEEMRFLIERYGEPRRLHFIANFLKFECDLVRKSQAKGRSHDVTCFIRKSDSKYVVIQKQQYARTGIYRAPSGGASIGESIEDAAIREMREETGLTIRLLRMVIDLSLDIVCREEMIHWRSLVFLAEPISGEMRPLDTHEIYDVAVMSREELLGDINRMMVESGWGGFAYRAFLTTEFFKAVDELGI